MENVATINAKSSIVPGVSDLKMIRDQMYKELPDFDMVGLNSCSPMHLGYCVHKTRTALCGVRKDIAAPMILEKCFNVITSNLIPVTMNWRAFLGKPMKSHVDLTRVGQRPNAAEQIVICQSGCSCSFNPMQICDKHPCKCHKCQSGDACSWRTKHKEFIEANYVTDALPYDELIKVASTLLQYVQVVEASGVPVMTERAGAQPTEHSCSKRQHSALGGQHGHI